MRRLVDPGAQQYHEGPRLSSFLCSAIYNVNFILQLASFMVQNAVIGNQNYMLFLFTLRERECERDYPSHDFLLREQCNLSEEAANSLVEIGSGICF